MSLLPKHYMTDDALAAIRWIDEALRALAFWCPHGLDTSRIGDYNAARDAREHLCAARLIIEVAITPMISSAPGRLPVE